MLATQSTGSIKIDHLSGRINSMMQILLDNSMAIDWPKAGCIELHFNDKEVHAKLSARLHTDDREKTTTQYLNGVAREGKD